MQTRRRPLSILIVFWVTFVLVHTAPGQTQENADKIVSRIPREHVPSSAIAAIGYSKRRQILEVEFVNGAIYRYLGVPRSIYHGLMRAGSKTRYFHEKIRGNFRSIRIRHWNTQHSTH